MSTSELLKRVKALPQHDRQKVFNAILELEEAERPYKPSKTKHVKMAGH
jgi:hypothetical protein